MFPIKYIIYTVYVVYNPPPEKQPLVVFSTKNINFTRRKGLRQEVYHKIEFTFSYTSGVTYFSYIPQLILIII